MTYGQLKFRLTKQFPGIDSVLIEGWINDRYAEILGELPWSRQNVESMLVTTAPYVSGSAGVATGSTQITLSGGVWAAGMTGMAFRVTGRSEFYEFTFLSTSTGSLDRPYEGPDAASAGYSIFQSVYPLPLDCGMLENDAFGSAMKRFSHAELDEIDPWRQQTGTPGCWASYMDDGSTPPRMQVELYPVPDQAVGIPFTYGADADYLSDTSAILKVWITPTALIEGVVDKIKRHLKDYAGAQLARADAKDWLADMRRNEAQGMGPARMKLGSYYTSHRAKRYSR